VPRKNGVQRHGDAEMDQAATFDGVVVVKGHDRIRSEVRRPGVEVADDVDEMVTAVDEQQIDRPRVPLRRAFKRSLRVKLDAGPGQMSEGFARRVRVVRVNRDISTVGCLEKDTSGAPLRGSDFNDHSAGRDSESEAIQFVCLFRPQLRVRRSYH
jgi:hypothetical protein